MNPVNQQGKCMGAWMTTTGTGSPYSTGFQKIDYGPIWKNSRFFWFWRLAIGLLAAILFFGSVAAGTAVAFEPEDRWNYGIVKIGVMHSTGDFDDEDYDPAFAAALSYGRYLTEHLIIEGGFDFLSSMDEREGYNNVVGGYDQDNYINVTSLMVTLKGEFPAGPVRLYFGGGIGAYYVSLNSEIDSDRRREFEDDGDDAVWGAHLVTGGYYNITPRLFMGFEGMYRWTEEVQIEETKRSVSTAYRGDLDGYQLVFTTGFRF